MLPTGVPEHGGRKPARGTHTPRPGMRPRAEVWTGAVSESAHRRWPGRGAGQVRGTQNSSRFQAASRRGFWTALPALLSISTCTATADPRGRRAAAFPTPLVQSAPTLGRRSGAGRTAAGEVRGFCSRAPAPGARGEGSGQQTQSAWRWGGERQQVPPQGRFPVTSVGLVCLSHNNLVN